MRKIFFILSAIIFSIQSANAYYDISTPVEGNTIADETLQFNVIKKIYKTFSKKFPACSDYSIKTTQIIHYPYDVKKRKDKYVAGYWKEMWTVNVCDTTRQIPVTFYINPIGATFYIDKTFLND